MLEVIHLYKSFEHHTGRISVIEDMNFRIEEGETCSFVGPSGSGKTTLLSICAGLDTASSGKVILCGVDLTTMNQDQLSLFRNKHIGFVFQSFQLIPTLTALENTMAPVEMRGGKPPVQQAKKLLDDVGLSNRLKHYPNELSGGEQQRVAIARCFINQPKIIFADEPTGNLDMETGAKVEALLFNLNKEHGTTLVIVTHNTDLAKKTDKIINIKPSPHKK